jgi:hypothetical protein
MDESFIKVRDFLDENPGAGVDTVVEKTDVPKRIITLLLKEGRLIMATGNGTVGTLHCELCKKPISTGRMCERCKDKLATTMQESITGSKSEAFGSHDKNSESAAKIGKRKITIR